MLFRSSEKGGLFKGITPEILVKELKKQVHIDLSADAIVLEKSIKEIGDYTINVEVGEQKTSFKVEIFSK